MKNMENNMMIPANYTPDLAEKMENMYPESYLRLSPHIANSIDMLDDDAVDRLTGEDIDMMAEKAVETSGVMHDPPSGHSRNTMSDLARILLIRRLFDRGRRRRAIPFYLYPHDGFHGGHGGGFYGGHGGGHMGGHERPEIRQR